MNFKSFEICCNCLLILIYHFAFQVSTIFCVVFLKFLLDMVNMVNLIVVSDVNMLVVAVVKYNPIQSLNI